MNDLAARCSQWRQTLIGHKEADDSSAATTLCVDIYTSLQRVVADRTVEVDYLGFAKLVRLMSEMEGVVAIQGILSLGGKLMTRRPERPMDDNADWPAEENRSTPKVVELFGLLARHSKAGSASFANQNVLHLLRQILAQHANVIPVEIMKPLLEHSGDITWACRTATNLNGEDSRPAWLYFERQSPLEGDQQTDTLPNQAWVGLLQHYLPYGMGDMEPECVLKGQLRSLAQDFDGFTKRVIEIHQAGIKMLMQRTDVVLISQMLERMALVTAKEAGTARAQFYAEAITALVDITVPELKKINNKNSLYAGVGKSNPMAKTAFYNHCTLKALKGTAIPLQYPEAAQALEHFRFQVLQHGVALSEQFRKNNPSFTDKEHIQALADLCSESLTEPKPLAKLTPSARLHLVREMNEGPIRRKLMMDDIKITKELFIEDLGM